MFGAELNRSADIEFPTYKLQRFSESKLEMEFTVVYSTISLFSYIQANKWTTKSWFFIKENVMNAEVVIQYPPQILCLLAGEGRQGGLWSPELHQRIPIQQLLPRLASKESTDWGPCSVCQRRLCSPWKTRNILGHKLAPTPNPEFQSYESRILGSPTSGRENKSPSKEFSPTITGT